VKEGKYEWCTLYMSMKIEQWNLLNCSKKGWGMRENDGGGESN
jgi:hypothetical protein